MTPLHLAAKRGHSGSVKCLVTSEANVNSQDDKGVSDYAMKNKILVLVFQGVKLNPKARLQEVQQHLYRFGIERFFVKKSHIFLL